VFGRDGSIRNTASARAELAKQAVATAANVLAEYVERLARDEKVRQRLQAAVVAGAGARERVRRQTGVGGVARRLWADAVLREQLEEMAKQLQAAQKQAEKARTRTRRKRVLFLSGVGMVIAAVPGIRKAIRSISWGRDSQSPGGAFTASVTRIDEEIEVAVPLSTVYNQWTQFEEFPRFMEGVEEVRQLDDTLLHWAASVGGRRAEWDAKIIEQQPDRRIVWESVDGRQTRGSVSLEAIGAERTRIRLSMSYSTDGLAERTGSAAGLDRRRVRADLERFRDLIEGRPAESGAWRGQISGGKVADAATTEESARM
jgi:uncharacterized membrane protein